MPGNVKFTVAGFCAVVIFNQLDAGIPAAPMEPPAVQPVAGVMV